MTDRETLYRALSHAAWGFVFLCVDFNIGTVSILPRFVGYLLFLSAINKLSGERRDLALIRPLCILLAAWTGVDWLFSWVGADPGGLFPPLNIVILVAALYFHFQFLTDMAALAEQYQPEGDDLDQRLTNRRTAYIVLSTVGYVLMYLPVGRLRSEEVWVFVMTALAMMQLVTALLIMKGLFDLRRFVREEGPEQPEL